MSGVLAARKALAVVLAALAVSTPGSSGAEPVASGAERTASSDEAFRIAAPGHAYRFPRDHGAHTAFRTEWWYYTGQLRIVVDDVAPGDEPADLGFQLTFFRSGVDRSEPPRPSAWALRDLYFAHLALTDLRGVSRGAIPGAASGAASGATSGATSGAALDDPARFRFAERRSRDARGMAGADTTTLGVWIGEWSVSLAPDDAHHLVARQVGGGGGGAGAALRAGAAGASFGLDLRLAPLKPPVIHGRDGVSLKGAGHGAASHYVSLTRLEAGGEVELDGRTYRVRGLAWMDHEFSTSRLDPGLVGWDWFGLHLDDGSDVMLYRMRRTDGSAAPTSSATHVDARGRATHLDRPDLTAEPVGETWESGPTGARYPLSWRLGLPAVGLTLRVVAPFHRCELGTTESTGVTYWEGPVTVWCEAPAGTAEGAVPAPSPPGSGSAASRCGSGYMELTGYAEAFRARL